jgi:hypothetical protein
MRNTSNNKVFKPVFYTDKGRNQVVFHAGGTAGYLPYSYEDKLKSNRIHVFPSNTIPKSFAFLHESE